MINFKCVRWKNFLSTGNQFTEIQLDKEPTTLIVGENGAGKSTILDALCFSLFGKPFRNISKMQMVNSINNSSAVVEVEFQIGTVKYKVVRSIKPNKFEIYQNSILINQEANARDYQKILEQQILKLNYRSFTQVVILGSSTFVPFMQLKARHRREVVEEILDIQIFSTMNLILKQRLKIILDDIRETDYQYQLASEKISFQENHIADLNDNKEKIIQQKQKLIETNEEEIFKRSKQRNELEVNITASLTSIDDKVTIDSKSTKLKDIQSTLVEKHKTHSSMIGFFENNEDCPTCQQHIDEIFKSDMISQKKTEADKIQVGMKELKTELDKVSSRKNEIKEITDDIRNNQVSMAKIDSSIVELEKFNVQLETEISQFKLDGSTSSDVSKLKELKNEAELCSRQKSKLREDKLYAEAARNMLQDTGIKTKIIKQYLPIMNKLINKYLTSMEFYVNFTLDENFEETIKSRYRDEFSYASFSEGEKMRIDLALLFTWRAVAKMKNSTNTNLLILDEIFDSSLDGTGTDEFLKILNTLSGENVFVISHKQDALADKFRSTIRFEKVKNFSHVAA
jgi:DNA repair exonuclease SbcCD ATPase subunit